ncbi:MAG: FmdB family zinc ribbon protein [Acidobacteriota bacterium]
MPIFEYLCPACNRIYSFLSLAVRPARDPVCPRCGNSELRRVPSAFAVAGARKSASEGGRDQAAGAGGEGLGGLEQEAMRMASELGEKDAEDPRVMARMMRRLAEASGEPITATMDEMFRRMEGGEDPEALEEELGPQLEAEMGGEGDEATPGGPPSRDEGLYDL